MLLIHRVKSFKNVEKTPLNVLKIGHVEFEVQDLARMTDYYRDTIGLTLTDQDADTAYLSTVVDHHSVVLRQSNNGTRLTKIAFQVAPVDADDLVNHLKGHGASAEIREGSQPSINEVVRTSNPDGLAIELYSEFEPSAHPYSFRGVNPVKLSHVSALSPDPKKTMDFYIDVLGFRFSDSVRDFFYFLRCGADHHTINLITGEYAGMQHFAFEVADMSHMQAACDVLIRQGVPVMWGPIRHGIGHNLAAYHLDPEGQVVEFCAELDRMSSEALGYYDPRPYHEDRPQRPKRWENAHDAGAMWGQYPPPAGFGKGISAAAVGIKL